MSLLFNSFITMCLHMIYCVIILLQVCRAPQKCLSIFSINFVQFSAVVSSDISSTLVFLFQCHIFKTFLLCPVCFSSSFLDFQSFLSLYFRQYIFFYLSSTLLILCFTVSNLPVNPTNNFLLLDIIYQL